MNGSNFPSVGWEITFREGWWLWSALGLALILLAVFSYRRTIPPLPPRRRALLFGLRLLALCAFILAILNPRLERRGMEPRPRRIALLVDESRSIARAGQESAVRSILASAQMKRVSALADVVALGFADTVRVLDEATLSFRGPATEIGEAILSQRRVFPPPDAIILITDGSNTSGSEPVRAAQEAALPTYVVGVGNPHPEPDARIVGVAAPPYAVEGEPVSVTVTWEHTIPGMRASTMRLFHQGREITRAIVLPPETGARADVDLTFTPSARGMQAYTVELEGVPGESRTENNRRMFSLDVVKAKKRALIIAGTPSADVGFWNRFFGAREDYDPVIW
ncbi:MAG TPA: vWA domain-containing protein, partial [Candidatus Latescibacteria bacterium]|nr:vWA domain-containing protein [Candidatus Latescibacterota bacterium]